MAAPHIAVANPFYFLHLPQIAYIYCMKIKDSLQSVRRTIYSFIILFPLVTSLKLWDVWNCFLSGNSVDWVIALRELNYYAIGAITLPLAIAIREAKVYKNVF